MTERVVDDFEAVEIEEEQRDFLVSALGVSKRIAQTILQKSAVRQLRKRIVVGQELDPLLGGFAFRNVFNSAFIIPDVVVHVAHRTLTHSHPFSATVLAVNFHLGAMYHFAPGRQLSYFDHPVGIDKQLGRHVLNFSHKFFWRTVAVQLRQCTVDADGTPFGIDLKDAKHGIFKDGPVLFLCLAHCGFRQLPLGNVAKVPDPAAMHPICIDERTRVTVKDLSILEFDLIPALFMLVLIEIPDLFDKSIRALDLFGHIAAHFPIVPRSQQFARNSKVEPELIVCKDDVVRLVDDQDAVNCGLGLRLQQRGLEQQRFFGLISCSNIVRDDQDCIGPMKIPVVPDDFDIDDVAILPAMPRDVGHLESASTSRYFLHKFRDFLLGAYVRYGHRQEFRLGISVLKDRSLIDRQETKGSAIEHPHWDGIGIEQEAVLLLRVPQRFFRPLPVSNVEHDGRRANHVSCRVLDR